MGGPMNIDQDPLLLMAQVRRWRMAFFGLVILLAGMGMGAGITMIWQAKATRPQANAKGLAGQGPAVELTVQRLKQSLGLSTKQVQAIRPIIREHMANINRIRQEVRPKVAEQLRSMAQRVAMELDPRQKELWNQQFRRLSEQLQWQLPGPRTPRQTAPRPRTETTTEPNQPG